MNGLHILKGTGDNCTCFDCPVLYGSDCYSTPMNNVLDEFDAFIENELVAKNKKQSTYQLFNAYSVIAGKLHKIDKYKRKVWDNHYSLLSPLFFMAWGKALSIGGDREMYRNTRALSYFHILDVLKQIEENEKSSTNED